MAEWNLRSTRREWDDWLGIILGIVIALALWIVEETSNSAAIANAAIAGVLVMVLAEADLVNFRRWIEFCQLFLGIWVAASPFFLGYADSGFLRVLHILAGLAIAAFSILQLRHDDRKNTSQRR